MSTRQNAFLRIILAALILFPSSVYAGSYCQNMKHDLSRGFKNILSSPLEIPITIQEYHESAGYPVIRHTIGFFDGTFRMIKRAGSGLWDFVVALIPGDQEGLPLNPETLF